MKQTIRIAIIGAFFLFHASNIKANEIAEEILAEHSSSYITSWIIIQHLKKTDCGYAIAFDSNQLASLANLAENEVLKKLPSKYTSQWPSFRKKSEQVGYELATKMYNTIIEIEDKSKDAQCNYLAGQITGILSTEQSQWKSTLYYFK